ncbi:hypothetical protein [Oceanotoga teriensis]|uniref:hypothetical protein n=1 Tax=Oceanotoga teriensis TaxID=515440 RepID=UPI0027127DE6|nr:hypothetical protein [Oceanotoga teriensis]MDO7975292.1 hypothetical protein [Oceanotoga teriensis]
MIYEILGWINVFLLILNGSLFILKKIYKNYKFKNSKNKIKYLSLLKKISFFHKINGLLIILIAIIHAYLILGTVFYIHTGSILLILIIINFLLYIFKNLKIFKKWLLIHKLNTIIIFTALIIHLTNPWIFG